MGVVLSLLPHSCLVGPPEPLCLADPEPFFCDWLSLYQTHVIELPYVDAGCVMSVDSNGQIAWKTVRKVKFEGSHDTSVQIRCDGHTVWFEGNVSRFGRTDNLFGFDLAECIRRVNTILSQFGLPPFTQGQKSYRTVRSDEGICDFAEVWSGARVTRIDLTANYSAGSMSDARAYMAWLATQQHSARIKVGTHFDGETVDWGRGSRRIYAKAYLKGPEIRFHSGPSSIADYCEKEGVIRYELTLKSTQLNSMGCQFLGSLNMHQLEFLFTTRQAVMSRAEHSSDDLEQLPNHFRRTARDYLAGDDVRLHLSLATFKRHRKALLPYGIDIAVRRNVVNFVPRVRVIELKPLSVPSWYEFGNLKVA